MFIQAGRLKEIIAVSPILILDDSYYSINVYQALFIHSGNGTVFSYTNGRL